MDALTRTLNGRRGALIIHAKYGRSTVAGWAYTGRFQKYLDRVDPEKSLPDAERQQRAKDLERADMIALAQRSREARAAKKKEAERLAHAQPLGSPNQ